MNRVRKLTDIALFYFSLSGLGRRLLRTIPRNLKKAGLSPSHELMNAARERKFLIRDMKACDRT